MNIFDTGLVETRRWKLVVDTLHPMIQGAAWTKFSHVC